MFLGDLPVASLGIMSLYFALRSRYLAYLLCATYMVFIKETSVALLVALLLYFVLRNKPETKEDFIYVVKYSVPLLAICFFFVWQKLATGHFFFIYPQEVKISLFVHPRWVFYQFAEITKWIFVYQQRYIFSALIALNLVINQNWRRRPELGLFFLICVLSGYSFSVLYFLPRYLLPVLPYLYLLGAWSLMELVKPAAWKTPAAVVTVFAMIWSLATQPFAGSAEFNLRYLDVVRLHKDMCEFIASEVPDSRIVTAFPHTRELQRPHLGYVKESLSVTSLGDNQVLREADLILVSPVPVTRGMEELKRYVLKNDWRLIRRLRKEPVITELYGRPK
jgi:hypothetical protein